jgi:hypothetical protein
MFHSHEPLTDTEVLVAIYEFFWSSPSEFHFIFTFTYVYKF